MDRSDLANIALAEELAKKVYYRKAKKVMGLTYLVTSSYVPLTFLLSVLFPPLVEGSLDHLELLVFGVYLLVVFSLGFQLRRIPIVAGRLDAIAGSRFSSKRGRLNRRYLPFVFAFAAVALGVAASVTFGLLGEVLGAAENLCVLGLILSYFDFVFSSIKVSALGAPDILAIAGAIVGFLAGTFVNPVFFFAFSASWFVAGAIVTKRYW